MKKITASILHRYEIFDICNQINKLNSLNELYCSYPKYEVIKYGIPKQKIKTFIKYELLTRINDYFWKKNFYFSKYDFFLTNYFDIKISKVINQNFDIFYGSGGMCLETFKILKPGIIKVFHSASMHIYTKKKLMINAGYNPDKIIDKEMENKYLKEIDRADYIICTSEHSYKSYLENKISEEKLILNPSGIDTERFYYNCIFDRDDDNFKFLFVGNLSLRKGGNKLLDAYIKIRNKNTKLIIAGTIDFTLRNEFNKFSEYTDIIYLGKIPNKKLNQIYSSCHLLCLFSNEEGFAKVLGESLSCGLPVLCSKNSGGSHFIKSIDHGIVLENLNLSTIIDSMKFYINRKNIIISNRLKLSNYAINNFSWRKSTGNLLKILNQLK